MVRAGIDALREAVSGRIPPPPCAQLLGWEALSIEPGRVRARFQAREEFLNPAGNVQGGLLAAMLDDAMGPALYTVLDEAQFAPTLEMKVSFLGPARVGSIVAEGRLVQRTRGIAFLEGALTDEDGRLIALATATARILGLQRNNGTADKENNE